MEKSKRKRIKRSLPAKKKKKTEKITKDESKASEYVSYLLELHKLQGVLLVKLDKEV